MTAKDIEQVVFATLQQHGLSRWDALGAARAVRVAAEGAAKGGEDRKRDLLQEVARACRGLGPITPAVEAVVGHAAEDAAKYRAAVELAKDREALAIRCRAAAVGEYPWSSLSHDERASWMDGASAAVSYALTLDTPPSGQGGDVTWLEPFCACGRRLSQCDRSRRACGGKS